MGAVTLYPAWKNAVERIVGGEFAHGDMITHDAMDELLELRKPSGRVSADEYKAYELSRLSSVEALRSALLKDHMMDLQNERGKGFRILMPHEQTNAAMTDGEAAIRKAIRTKKARLVHVNHSALTAEQRKENTDAIIRTAAQVQALRQIKRGLLPDVPKRIRKSETA